MRNVIYILAGICSCFMISCSPVYYMPNTHHVPMLTEKGEFSGQVTGSEGQGEASGAYAVTDNMAIMATGSFFFPTDDGNTGRGSLFEAGVGYFKPVIMTGVVFETYGLLGYGNVKNYFENTIAQYPGTTGRISAQAFRLAVQPSLSYKSKYFSLGLSSRIGYLNYFGVDGNFIFEDVDQVKYLKDNNSHLLFEPAITLRGGLEKVKLQLQIGTSVNLTHSNFRQEAAYMTMGVQVNFLTR